MCASTWVSFCISEIRICECTCLPPSLAPCAFTFVNRLHCVDTRTHTHAHTHTTRHTHTHTRTHTHHTFHTIHVGMCVVKVYVCVYMSLFPYLWNEDLRMYVIATSACPVRIYLYEKVSMYHVVCRQSVFVCCKSLFVCLEKSISGFAWVGKRVCVRGRESKWESVPFCVPSKSFCVPR